MNKALLESKAWNKLTRKEQQVFIYLWSCLTWATAGSKKLFQATNNGDIEVSSIIMGRKLKISKQTISKAIHTLIEVGLIKLTRVGENKVCHMYKILYEIVPTHQERWRKYPAENWKDECPKAPNKLVGKGTQLQDLRADGRLYANQNNPN
tara:strand:- start:757 stop:1209 length:453 start_codon:yes stop_codon:yes gene_type:complete